jgi:ribosome-associated protein
LAAVAAEEKKASDIVILDVSRVSWMNDALVLCTADSERQVQAIKDNIDKVLSEKGHRLYGVEGAELSVWILMDYDSVVVHIFKRGVRELYGLDRIWADASKIPLRGRTEPAALPLATGQPDMRKERSLKQRG